ncbi:unnamed protein product, partial [Rotaria socialis]
MSEYADDSTIGDEIDTGILMIAEKLQTLSDEYKPKNNEIRNG